MARPTPGRPIICRWCRSHLGLARWARWLRDGLLAVGGAFLVTRQVALYLDTGDPVELFYLLVAAIPLVALATLVEFAAPLRTRVPRDYRKWETDPQPAARVLPAEER
ncbi:MAG: hypothetical protein Q9Q40_13385 [Acidobacteriota bacterium]|nr:hypothetical protein [Acidobacteriota bacterium]MDQ7088510.1 hypothetical protein [Acidobacteriota bacterium]